MKNFFTLIFIFSFSHFIQSQNECTDLFFSEYIEGWSNNKALEIYNPTSNSVDLSAYSISRYSNGGTSPSTTQLEGTIGPCSTFVVGLDKQDENGTGFEAPMWDGWYTYTDSITGEEVSTYNADSDLQGKIDLFINPVYYFGTNQDSLAAYPNSLYFNGNDAVTLEVLGGGLVDLFGKVGEDPGTSWTDGDGNSWTKDHTLIRKSSVMSGVIDNPTVFDPTLEWDSLPVNTFINLGTHDCDCNCTPNTNILELENTFSIYPNPTTKSKITILNNMEISHVSIHNNFGQLITNRNTDNMKQITINLPEKKGVYFISIKDSKMIKTKSIIVR